MRWWSLAPPSPTSLSSPPGSWPWAPGRSPRCHLWDRVGGGVRLTPRGHIWTEDHPRPTAARTSVLREEGGGPDRTVPRTAEGLRRHQTSVGPRSSDRERLRDGGRRPRRALDKGVGTAG